MMKKFIYATILAGGLTLTSSCQDMLQEEAQSQIEKPEFMNDASEAEVVLLGVYRGMVSDAVYGMNLSMLFDMSTDLSQCTGGTTGYRQVTTNSMTTSDSYVQNTWRDLYAAIYTANDFLETIATRYPYFTALDKQKADIYIAEARALRALYYFELLRYYGNIILMETTADSYKKNSEFVQAAPEEVYAFIEEDLKYHIFSQVLNSKNYGIPQNRERLFCIGFLGVSIDLLLLGFLLRFLEFLLLLICLALLLVLFGIFVGSRCIL